MNYDITCPNAANFCKNTTNKVMMCWPWPLERKVNNDFCMFLCNWSVSQPLHRNRSCDLLMRNVNFKLCRHEILFYASWFIFNYQYTLDSHQILRNSKNTLTNSWLNNCNISDEGHYYNITLKQNST